MMDVQQLLDEEEAGWKDIKGVFAAVPPERFEEPGVTPEGWSPKDAMFHLGAWLAECGAVLERIRSSTPSRTEGGETTESKNAAWFQMSKTMEPAIVRVELEAARASARLLFGSLADVTPEAWSWFEESGPLHYAEHAKDLRDWLARS